MLLQLGQIFSCLSEFLCFHHFRLHYPLKCIEDGLFESKKCGQGTLQFENKVSYRFLMWLSTQLNNHHLMVIFLVCAGNLSMMYYLQSKVTEKFKRPFKKRHSSVYHQPSNRVNKYLAQAIDARSVDREKSTHVNLATLCFKDHEKENQVCGF